MSHHAIEAPGPFDLRLRAHAHLNGHGDAAGVPVSASAALGVLHELASSPSTAADALAVLHELQVHQVELDLQADELRSTRATLEADLQRQVRLYDAVPVGLFTIEAGAKVCEANATGARLLGAAPEALIGRALDGFFVAHSARALHAMLERVGAGHRIETGTLELLERNGVPRVVQVSVSADPAGARFLVAALDLRGA